MDMHTEGTTAKRGGAMKHGRHARGGKADEKKVNLYNAAGSPEAKEAEDETPDFKRGGHKKRADGGHAEGEMAEARLDKAKRGKHEKRAAGGRAGGSPYSLGKTLTQGKGDPGREGVKVPASD